LCLCWAHCFVRHSDLPEFSYTHNAAMFSSKCKAYALLLYRYVIPSLLDILFVLMQVKLGIFCQFTVVHFGFCLISNIFSCRYASVSLRTKRLTFILSIKMWCQNWKLPAHFECWHYLLPSSWLLLVTSNVIICDHAVRLSKFGMLITLLNYCTVPCPVTYLSKLICKSSIRTKQSYKDKAKFVNHL